MKDRLELDQCEREAEKAIETSLLQQQKEQLEKGEESLKKAQKSFEKTAKHSGKFWMDPEDKVIMN